MEYADGGDLNKEIEKYKKRGKLIPEDVIWWWFLQICQAIRYMHNLKIIHRDIKVKNTFLTKKNIVKLGDFGISKRILTSQGGFTDTLIGTPFYISPEMCLHNKYNFKADMWMMGCLLYELATLNKPFQGRNIMEVVKAITDKDYPPIPDSYSQGMKDIIEKLLKKDPNLRPSIKDIHEERYIRQKMLQLGMEKNYKNWDEFGECDFNPPLETNFFEKTIGTKESMDEMKNNLIQYNEKQKDEVLENEFSNLTIKDSDQSVSSSSFDTSTNSYFDCSQNSTSTGAGLKVIKKSPSNGQNLDSTIEKEIKNFNERNQINPKPKKSKAKKVIVISEDDINKKSKFCYYKDEKLKEEMTNVLYSILTTQNLSDQEKIHAEIKEKITNPDQEKAAKSIYKMILELYSKGKNTGK